MAAVPAPSISSMGSIVALDLDAAPKNLSLLGKDGRVLDLVIDPNDTVVLQGGKVTTPEHLKQGQKVRVYHALKDRLEVATSIHILEPEPMSPTTSGPAVDGL